MLNLQEIAAGKCLSITSQPLASGTTGWTELVLRLLCVFHVQLLVMPMYRIVKDWGWLVWEFLSGSECSKAWLFFRWWNIDLFNNRLANITNMYSYTASAFSYLYLHTTLDGRKTSAPHCQSIILSYHGVCIPDNFVLSGWSIDPGL